MDENIKPENVIWDIKITDFQGPFPDWSDMRITSACKHCGSNIKRVYTYMKINNEPNHKVKCANFCGVGSILPFYVTKTIAEDYEVPFGVHKGKRLSETPASWRKWIMEQPTMSKSIKRRIIALDGLDIQI